MKCIHDVLFFLRILPLRLFFSSFLAKGLAIDIHRHNKRERGDHYGELEWRESLRLPLSLYSTTSKNYTCSMNPDTHTHSYFLPLCHSLVCYCASLCVQVWRVDSNPNPLFFLDISETPPNESGFRISSPAFYIYPLFPIAHSATRDCLGLEIREDSPFGTQAPTSLCVIRRTSNGYWSLW